ncbi:mog1 [Symbiodinium natans]|uniref:Mog1 protein n=1 Tax=Symbiodinium natans TaxID=878477 RepID=A0A812MLV2_9DINO|nr:mog1 [Symbiodinium natans]
MAGGHEVPLYGGAMVCELPRTMTDSSVFRQVPDHQEVWVDTSSDRSVMIEILEQKEVPDGQAIDFFLSDLATSNEAQDAVVLESHSVPAGEVPHLPSAARCLAGVGEQTVAKFREDRGNRVRIYAAAIRLPEVSTDILITLNDPVHLDPESSSAQAPTPTQAAEDVFRVLLSSFRIVDWGLFGEG